MLAVSAVSSDLPPPREGAPLKGAVCIFHSRGTGAWTGTESPNDGPETPLRSGWLPPLACGFAGGEARFATEFSWERASAQGCRLLAYSLLSVFKAQRWSFLTVAVVQCRSLCYAWFISNFKYSYLKCGLPESCGTILYLSGKSH